MARPFAFLSLGQTGLTLSGPGIIDTETRTTGGMQVRGTSFPRNDHILIDEVSISAFR